ncbi:MAG TPA: insulinase family protein [Acidimicrobiia bacterium]|nr:insulinase family protein [Acidimicrobiia bacterium]
MRRFAVVLAAFALLAAACGGGTGATSTTTSVGEPTTTSTAGTTTTTTRGPATIPGFPDDDEPVDLDPAVVQGTLDNGLVYYIRENQAPGGRAQLRLAVKVGSVQEEADQRGVAHYLEHMMFNGTERFPANELVRVLQRFGSEFGADINAYTSYEETVYFLDLPTEDPATIATGFDVLLEWASAVTLDPVEVDLERGVLLEEWRLRDQGFWGRYFVGVTERLLAGTPFAERSPLAGPEMLDGTTVEGLRDFYDTWYRPDTMAIIAVGDFDADTIEGLITERFEDLVARAESEPLPDISTEPFDEPSFFILADPESPETFVELNYPVPVDGDPGTVGAVRANLASQLAFDMLATRLHEDTLRAVKPYWDPSYAANPLVRAQASPGVAAYTSPEDLLATTEELLREVERARRFGFTADELTRALERRRAAVESDYEARGSTQDRRYAAIYTEHFLGGDPAASAADWRALNLRLLDEMTTDQVWDTFAATIESTHPLIILAGPEASEDDFPEEPALDALLREIAASDLGPRDDEVIAIGPLMEAPEPGRVDSRTSFSDTGLPLLQLDNGAWVVLFPTTIHEGHVTLLGASPGGWALLPTRQVAEAKLLADIIDASGVGDLDAVALERHLVGKVVTLTAFVDEVEEGFFGTAATGDLEVLLQLLHLQLTAPRFDEIAVDIVRNRWEPIVEEPLAVPDRAVAVTLADIRFSGDPRFAHLVPAGELADLGTGDAAALFASRFGNVGDFVFALVGDFDPDEAEDLVLRYVASLPGSADLEPYNNTRPDPPTGIVTEVVEAGSGSRGGVVFHFTTPVPLDPDVRVRADVLEAIIQDRLTARIREELSASYSPSVLINLIENPEDLIEITIRIDGDPENLDEVVAATLDNLESLVAQGPSADEFAIGREQILRNYELIDNVTLAQAAIFSAFSGEPYSEIITRIDRVAALTSGEVRDLIGKVITLDDYIEIRLVPEDFAG